MIGKYVKPYRYHSYPYSNFSADYGPELDKYSTVLQF